MCRGTLTVALTVLLVCGCGRLGFESSQLQPTDSGPDVAQQPDAALTEMLLEGETLITDSSVVSSETGRTAARAIESMAAQTRPACFESISRASHKRRCVPPGSSYTFECCLRPAA